MKHICFFIYSISGTGGTERACCEIANSLYNHGYNVTILSMYGDKPFFDVHPGIALQHIYRGRRRSKLHIPGTVYKIRMTVKRINPSILISVDAAIFSYAFAASLFQNVAHIVWEHFNFNVSLGAGVRVLSRRLAAKYSKAIVTLTHTDLLNWKTHLNCSGMLRSISNPSPFPRIEPDDTARKPVVLSIGRLTYQKGFDRLLEAWSAISGRIAGGWELHIVGGGELKKSLQDLILAFDLSASVKMITETRDIEQHYKEAGIYCMTSRFEGFPMVLIEAQCFGLPIVSYDCQTGPSELISPDNGILVADGDIDTLGSSILNLMNNKELRSAMGRNAYNNSAKYQTDTVITEWISLFNAI
jgi:glycosyltransferase involved in cell wall biosynthesis